MRVQTHFSDDERKATLVPLIGKHTRSDALRFYILDGDTKKFQDYREIMRDALPNGETPLTFAIKGKAIEVAEALLDNGADIKGENKQSETPLALAVQTRQVNMLRMLTRRDPTLASTLLRRE